MLIGIYDEIGADIATLIIFGTFLYFILRDIKPSEIFYSTVLIAAGIITIAISDIVGLLTAGTYIECFMNKLTAVGALGAALGILHAVSVYPKKNIVYKTLPSIYTLSVVMVIYLFASPHFLYCNPVTGGEHGPFWDIYIIWVYSVFFLGSGVLFLRLLTTRVKIVRLRYFYMTVGVVVTLAYLGLAQVVPIYVESVDYFTAVHILPFMGAMFLIAMLKYGMFILNPVREPGHRKEGLHLKEGEVLGISSIHNAYLMFRDLITEEPGIIITVRPPRLIAERYLIRKTPIIWLTYFPGDYPNALVPDRLHFEVMDTLIHFIHNGGRAIMIDGAEYLISNFGRRFFMEFVEELRQTGNIMVLMAVNEPDILEGFADTTMIKRIYPPEPRIMAVKDCKDIPMEDTLIITTHDKSFNKAWEKASLLRITDDFNADRMIFEGIKKVEESTRKNVYIECMDYLLSTASEKDVMNLLKDIIDIKVSIGGRVYIRYTPRIEESEMISQFVEFSD